MNTGETAPANAKVSGADFTSRTASIDIFRGLTVLVMVFVDNLDFIKGLTWWTYHMPRQANGMTYVDMVFPAFLFVMECRFRWRSHTGRPKETPGAKFGRT